MKILSIIISAFLLVGCTSARQGASLNPQQAKTLALQAANEKALALYHCQPFRDGRPAHFVAGRWIWTSRQGFGHGDIEAAVELAADGSARHVELKLLDTENIF